MEGTGNIPDFPGNTQPTFYSYRADIKSVEIGSGITGIGMYAFYNLFQMTEVTIPDTVTEIRQGAFQACSSLEEVRIPSSTKRIGEEAFFGCGSLISIQFEGAAPTFGSNVFKRVEKAFAYYPPHDSWTASVRQQYGGDVTWELYNNEIGSDVTWSLSGGKVTISGTGETYNYMSSIHPSPLQAFKEEITSITVSSGVTKIGNALFAYLESLKKVELPSGLTDISDLAFYGCRSLPAINLPSGLKKIGWGAFGECSSLSEITIPASVNEIRNAAFRKCDSLTKINVASANSTFSSTDGVLFSKQKTLLICYPAGKAGSSYTIPEGTAGIGGYAFSGSKNLTTVTVPAGVIFEDDNTFEDCAKLQKVILGEGIETISNCTFLNCTALKEIVIPASVTSILYEVFDNDTNLKNVYFKGAPPLIASTAFKGVTAAAYYPEALADLWPSEVRQNYGGNLTWAARHVDVTDMKFAKTSLEIPVGKTAKPEVIFTPADASTVLSWSSSAPGVASVDGDGNVTAKKVGKTTISASAQIGGKTVTIKCAVNVLFKDVVNKGYAPYTAIYALNEEGIVAGFSDGSFKPNDPVTRGQVLVFLWRSAGKPKPKSSTITFKDAAMIKALGNQYVSAVLWGIEQGITEGYTDNTFRPNTNCTRGQIVTFLWRYKGKPAPKAGYTGSFPDVPKNHTFYKAVSWAASYKITTGFSDGTFGPSKNCTRGQCVAFIYRMLNL